MFYKYLDKIASDSDTKQILESSQSIFNHITQVTNLLYLEDINKANQKNKCQEIFHLDFMPIECFKENPEKYFKGDNIYHYFLSSGTGSIRSRSLFSKKGLFYYKIGSLLYFKYVMDSFFNTNSLDIKGFSLIPHSSSMKESSLSKMVSWIAEYFNVEFLSIDDFIQKFTSSSSKDPIWIFATAIELLDITNILNETGKKINLSSNSAIIETGGNKAKNKKTLTRKELYTRISSFFNIPENNIISEYGMSELASSAYDWLSFDQRTNTPLDIKKRFFKFAPWVLLDIEKLNTNDDKGSLIIDDKLRIDYPYPIRTQDLCFIHDKHSFQYEKRVPFSVLKGCSLSMPQIQSQTWLNEVQINSNKFLKINKKDILKRISIMDSFLKEYLSSTSTQDLYSKVLESKKQSLILKEILLSLPPHTKSWLKTIYTSLNLSKLDIIKLNLGSNIETKLFDTILMLFSSTNEMALIYPVSIAYICGFNIKIKLSTRSSNKLSLSFIDSLNNYIIKNGLLSSIKQINPDNDQDISIQTGSIFISGDSSTIEFFKGLYPNRVQGFGSSTSISLTVDMNEFEDIKKDAFLLQQKGCLSTRFLFIINKSITKEEVINSISTDTSWLDKDSNYCYSLKNLESYLTMKNISFKQRQTINEPLFPIYEFDNISSFNAVQTEIPYPFSLAIIIIKQDISTFLSKDLDLLLKKIPNLKLILIPNTHDNIKIKNIDKNIEIRYSGEANRYLWDGTFQNKRLWRY